MAVLNGTVDNNNSIGYKETVIFNGKLPVILGITLFFFTLSCGFVTILVLLYRRQRKRNQLTFDSSIDLHAQFGVGRPQYESWEKLRKLQFHREGFVNNTFSIGDEDDTVIEIDSEDNNEEAQHSQSTLVSTTNRQKKVESRLLSNKQDANVSL